MNINELLFLVSEASNGKDNFVKGAIGFNGYGFVFKSLDSHLSYVTYLGSSGAFGTGAYRDITKKFKKFQVLDPEILFNYDEKYDLLLAGSLKTLVPELQFGGYEILFDVWMFVKTPNGEQFPARFYYGSFGTQIAGWQPDYIDDDTGEKLFPEKFETIINSSPFSMDDNQKNLFLDALEFALKKVPISDFWGVFNHDLGNRFMGVKHGRPFIKELGDFKRDTKAKKKIKRFIGKDLITKDGLNVNVLHLPRNIYVIDFKFDQWFGEAKKILEYLKCLL